MKGKFCSGIVVGVLLVARPAFAADSLLDPTPGPCATALEGPDYVPGTDANGRAVDPADIGADRVPVPGQILVPLPGIGSGRGTFRGRGSPAGRGAPAYATIDGARLDRLVNPEFCPPSPVSPPPARRR